MKILGLTGGIGSGKTYLCTLFTRLGVPCFNADNAAKTLYAQDAALRDELVALLGKEILGARGTLLPRQMAALIFADPKLRAQVNALVHPRVLDAFLHWAAGQAEAPYVVLESALLLEIALPFAIEGVVTVSAPEDLRLQRILARDGGGAQAALSRLRAQATDAWREERARFVIHNDGLQALLPQVWAVHEVLTGRHDN